MAPARGAVMSGAGEAVIARGFEIGNAIATSRVIRVMKALASYASDVSYETLSEDTAHILVPLETHALTQGFAQGFSDLLTKIRETRDAEATLVLAVARAEGHIVAVDGQLDVLVTAILDTIAARRGKTSALYLFLTGGRTPADIRAPVLDEELDLVKTWLGPLGAVVDPLVQEQTSRLAALIAEADQRVSNLADAEQALAHFQEMGPRRALIDGANALRASVHGALHQLASTPEGAALPSSFADRVFQFERARRRRKEPSVKDLEKLIAALDKERQRLADQLAGKKAAEAKRLRDKAKKKAKPAQDALAAARKKAATLAAQIAALEGEVGTPPPSK